MAWPFRPMGLQQAGPAQGSNSQWLMPTVMQAIAKPADKPKVTTTSGRGGGGGKSDSKPSSGKTMEKAGPPTSLGPRTGYDNPRRAVRPSPMTTLVQNGLRPMPFQGADLAAAQARVPTLPPVGSGGPGKPGELGTPIPGPQLAPQPLRYWTPPGKGMPSQPVPGVSLPTSTPSFPAPAPVTQAPNPGALDPSRNVALDQAPRTTPLPAPWPFPRPPQLDAALSAAGTALTPSGPPHVASGIPPFGAGGADQPPVRPPYGGPMAAADRSPGPPAPPVAYLHGMPVPAAGGGGWGAPAVHPMTPDADQNQSFIARILSSIFSPAQAY